MGIYINKGNEGFRNYTHGLYVDKTDIISYINSVLNTANRLTCVTRPRRFGKSITANMLCAYYDKSCDSSALFARYSISKAPSYKEHLNKYPVIYLDVTKFTTTYRRRKDLIKIIQKTLKDELLETYPDIKIPRNADLMRVLLSIVESTGQKFIMIVDEWDAPCREFSNRPELMIDYIDMLRRMFKTDDTAIVFAGVYITGILPIKKYGTQSALNDFREYSMTQSGAMGGFLGFNDADVKRLAEEHDMDYAELKRWYDGYELDTFDWRDPKAKVSKISIYNPNSVMTAIRDRKCDNYWSKSEAFKALQQYIDMDFDGVQKTLEDLIQGTPVYLNAMRFGNDQNSIGSNEELFTLLTHFGYLSYNQDNRLAVLPNQEIREEFVEALRGSKSHRELSKLVCSSDELLKATWRMDQEAVAMGISNIHNNKVAPNFYNNEQALRSVVRMAYLGAIDHYIEIQELPSGKGYCDIAFLPRRNSGKPAMVVELKWNGSTESALKQIKERQYPDILSDFSGEVLLVGINYDKENKKHTCMIEKFGNSREIRCLNLSGNII